jgi:integrase
MARLTQAAVEKMKAGAARREVPDAGAPGLHLIIQPSGSKTWAVRFRRPDGTRAKVTLGPLDTSGRIDTAPVIGQPLTLIGARSLATEIAVQRARGADVVEERRAEKQRKADQRRVDSENTYAIVAQDFVAEYRKDRRAWRSLAKMIGLTYSDEGEPVVVNGGLCDRWRDKAMRTITEDDIHALIGEARRKHIPGMKKVGEGPSDSRARHLGDALAALFRWAKRERIIKVDPTKDVELPAPPESRERVLNFYTDVRGADELVWFWKACGEVGAPFGVMCKVLLLTGCRRNEVAWMEWAELNDDRSRLSLPGKRTKNGLPHDVYFSQTVRDLIEGLPVIGNGCEYVFTTNGKRPVSGFSKFKKELDAVMLRIAKEDAGNDAAIAPWTLHDLRRTVSTAMNELSLADPHVVEACINHQSGHKSGVGGVYNKARYWPQKIVAFMAWTDKVLEIVEGRITDNVVPMRRA